MENHHFTIIIPTRERSDTLFYTLKTCVEQDYDKLTILVSDNFSRDNTKEVVFSFHDERIKYINTRKRLEMSGNWELALNHVNSDFITYIGDDDGLLLNCISEIDNILSETGLKGLTWRKIEYCWPDHIIESFKNYLEIGLSNQGYFYKGLTMLQKLASFSGVGYNMLPCLYNSFIDYNLIKNIKDQSEGIFFRAISPDVYSAIAIAGFIDEYVYSEKPYSINGASRHSNGTSQVNITQNQTAALRFKFELETSYDERLVLCPSVTMALGDAFLKVKKYIPSLDSKIEINIQDLLEHTIQEVCFDETGRYECIKDAMIKIGQKNNLSDYVNELITKYPYTPKKNIINYGLDINNYRLILNGDLIGIKDVYQASKFCSFIMQNHHLEFEENPNEDILCSDEVKEKSLSMKLTEKIKFLLGRTS